MKYSMALLPLCFASAIALPQSVERVRIANEGAIRDSWTLAPGAILPAPGYPGEFAERGDNVCVAIGYRIKPDGITSDFTLLRAWSSSGGHVEPMKGYWDAFSQASVAALSQWRFAPRADVGMPKAVDTVATMTFMGKHAEDAAGLRARCKINDLVSYLEQVKEDRAKRGDMNRLQLEKVYMQQKRNDMIRTPRQ